MSKGKWAAGCLIAAGVVLVGVGLWIGPALKDFADAGFFERTQQKRYAGDSMANLKAQHTALMLYHESEGQFPVASGWMDAIANRLQTADLEPGQGAQKLVRPGAAPGAYGYAMNDAASGKYKDDVPGGDAAPLVFESEDATRNAHGDPSKAAKGAQGVTISGSAWRAGAGTRIEPSKGQGRPAPSPSSR